MESEVAWTLVLITAVVHGLKSEREHVASMPSLCFCIFVLVDGCYSVLLRFVLQMVEFRNYHMHSLSMIKTYGELRFSRPFLRRLQQQLCKENGNHDASKATKVGFKPSNTSTEAVVLSDLDVEYTNQHLLDHRFELCVERLEEDSIYCTFNLPTSLLLNLARSETRTVRPSLYLAFQQGDWHSMPSDQPPSPENISENCATVVSAEVLGDFVVRPADIQIWVNGKVHSELILRLEQKSVRIMGLKSSTPCTIVMCLLDYTSAPLHCTTLTPDGLFRCESSTK